MKPDAKIILTALASGLAVAIICVLTIIPAALS